MSTDDPSASGPPPRIVPHLPGPNPGSSFTFRVPTPDRPSPSGSPPRDAPPGFEGEQRTPAPVDGGTDGVLNGGGLNDRGGFPDGGGFPVGGALSLSGAVSAGGALPNGGAFPVGGATDGEPLHVPAIAAAVKSLKVRLDHDERFLLGITGSPGSGKSTFADWLQRQFAPGSAVVVPMDGFHLGNAIIDGTPLRQRKGAIDTFDAGGYLSLLQRLARRDEHVVYAPEFRRSLDEPVAASIAVPADVPLVITEGNYLLAQQPPWPAVRSQLDEVWFVETPRNVRLARLVERHVSFGMDHAAAEAWANGSDEANARLIEATRETADRILPWV